MTVPLHEIVRDARRKKGLTQAQVAVAIGAKQSAVSMFENGRPDALSGEKMASIGRLLGVEAETAAGAVESIPRGAARFCPDPDCPSNVPFLVGTRVVLQPAMIPVAGDSPAYCRLCGEVLVSACPNPQCRQQPAPGAFCSACGTAYIETGPAPSPADAWVRSRQQSAMSLLELTEGIANSPAIRGRT
jgi:transcriptional regulator with XRE-family HTH domain